MNPAILSRSTLLSLLLTLFLVKNAYAGIQVAGTQLLDGNNQAFVIRGINHPHAWYPSKTHSFVDIAATGANTIRVVLSYGHQWSRNTASDVANVISLCKTNKLICILEAHDVTGSGEVKAAGNLADAANYWTSIKSVLKGEEDFVIINIANEPIGNNQPADAWIKGHRKAIKTIRSAGLTHALLVDAANWGQDWQETMLEHASTVAKADKLSNTFFSVHMYEMFQNREKIEQYISSFLSKHNLPIIVGEFGDEHNGKHVDEDSILAVADAKSIGYIAWSWSGNGDCCTNLDLIQDFNPKKLSTWGERIINGKHGIAETSIGASIYTEDARSLVHTPDTTSP